MYVVLMEHWFGLSGVLRELNNLKEVLWIDLLGVDIWPHHLPCPNLVRSPGWGTHSHVTHPFDLAGLGTLRLVNQRKWYKRLNWPRS
jgi:hypothetical protein